MQSRSCASWLISSLPAGVATAVTCSQAAATLPSAVGVQADVESARPQAAVSTKPGHAAWQIEVP